MQDLTSLNAPTALKDPVGLWVQSGPSPPPSVSTLWGLEWAVPEAGFAKYHSGNLVPLAKHG